MNDTLRCIFFAFALLMMTVTVTHLSCGCGLFRSAGPAAAEAAYGAALLRCVDEATTLEESKACRARVDAEWGIAQTATDGGAK